MADKIKNGTNALIETAQLWNWGKLIIVLIMAGLAFGMAWGLRYAFAIQVGVDTITMMALAAAFTIGGILIAKP